jgi:hypothetical protein
LKQIREARSARHTEVMLELGRRWDSDEMIESRTLADAHYREVGGLLKAVQDGFKNKDASFYKLMREPDFLEDLAIHYFYGSMAGEQLYNSMGLLIPERWEMWEDAVMYLRQARDSDMVLEQFQRLQGEMLARRRAPVPKVRMLRLGGGRLITFSRTAAIQHLATLD